MGNNVSIPGLVALTLLLIFISTCGSKPYRKENYTDPIYSDPDRLTRLYINSNESIYGCCSNVLTGYPFYPKAY